MRPRARTLRPTQIRAVAARHLQDAQCLLRAGRPHANGAVYLAGYVIECHLKADLLSAYPSLAVAEPKGLDQSNRRRWDLLFRWHNLDALIANLPGTADRLRQRAGIGGDDAMLLLKQVAAVWSVYLRYDTRATGLSEATEFVGSVERLHQWLAVPA